MKLEEATLARMQNVIDGYFRKGIPTLPRIEAVKGRYWADVRRANIEGASVCRRFGRFPRRAPAVVVLLSLVGLAQAGEAPRLDQPPTEIRHGLLTGFVRVDQGVGRAKGEGVAWTIFRDRLDLQVPLRPDLVVEASWDLVTVQDDPSGIHPLNYPTFAGSLGPKKSLLSSSTGPAPGPPRSREAAPRPLAPRRGTGRAGIRR